LKTVQNSEWKKKKEKNNVLEAFARQNAWP